MTTHRATPKPRAAAASADFPPVERGVSAVLFGALVIGVVWLGAMMYTIAGWAMD
ncbi:morphogenic membrane protein MmpA [Streptomyces sp. NPDC059909]|uniref:morphogenic membrane protein MmpA n=1 Tax=Streptomyces sp. NPDC059909 TaxID=3346998 RepID=UPI003658220A